MNTTFIYEACPKCRTEIEIELDLSDFHTWDTVECTKCGAAFKVMVDIKLEEMK